jgi:hypothetical protein
MFAAQDGTLNEQEEHCSYPRCPCLLLEEGDPEPFEGELDVYPTLKDLTVILQSLMDTASFQINRGSPEKAEDRMEVKRKLRREIMRRVRASTQNTQNTQKEIK